MRGQDGGGNGGTTTIVGSLCVSSSLYDGVSSLILLQLLRGYFSVGDARLRWNIVDVLVVHHREKIAGRSVYL